MDLALNDAIHSTLHWAVLQPTSARCNLPTAHTQEVGSYDGTTHGDSFFSEGVSHFNTAELTEVYLVVLTSPILQA